MYLIVGLGNPGPQYENTRHNVGFWFINELAQEIGVTVTQSKFDGIMARGTYLSEDIILFKPLTYMNRSGGAIAQTARFFKIPPENIIVVFDDLDMAPGKVKQRIGGSAGGHNGIRSMLSSLGTDKFIRLKIGIGKPEYKTATVNWVIGKMSEEEQEILKNSFPEIKKRLELIFKQNKKK